jgi:class 3 adenylate cyclase
MEIPDVAYTRSGDVAIAYQVIGDGPADLVLLPFHSNLYSLWLRKPFAAFCRNLARDRRLIVINLRGVGLSDRTRGFTIESRMDDVHAVLDDVDVRRPSLVGIAESAATCALFAASYPERTERLVLFIPFVRGTADELERDAEVAKIRAERARYGERGFLEELARRINPQWSDDPEYLEWFVWHHRLTASPASWAEFRRMQLDLDVGDVLPTIRVPTLVLSKQFCRDEAEEVARAIPGAEHQILPGVGSAIFENDFALEAIDAFLTGTARLPVPESVLATLLFTDLVASTERAVEVGDHRWSELLDEHRRLVRHELARYRGTELDTAGDGFFAAFDGPARAIACARAVAERTRTLGLDVRAGIHTGECERSDGKLAGLAVHVGARVLAAAGPGEVVVSGTVRDLVAGSGFGFDDLGERELKGVPGSWRLLRVVASSS